MYPISTTVSPADIERIEVAKQRSKAIRRAVGVALFNGWSLGLFAFLSIPFVLFGDFASLVCGVVLGIFAFNEFRGAARLKKFDRSATKLLGWNQVALGIAIAIYAFWSMSRPMSSELQLTASGDAQVDASLQNVTSMLDAGFNTAKLIIYGAIAVIGLLVPGLNALYYFTRGKHIDTMVASTEPWVIQTLRAAA